MTINSEQIQALRAAADATPATEWEFHERYSLSHAGGGYVSINGVEAIWCLNKAVGGMAHSIDVLRYITAANPAAIRSLLAERDADKALIAEQAKSIAKLERALDLARNSNSVLAIRSELEASTLNVKLPEPPGPMSLGARAVYIGIVSDVVGAFQESCAAAGITLVVGE